MSLGPRFFIFSGQEVAAGCDRMSEVLRLHASFCNITTVGMLEAAMCVCVGSQSNIPGKGTFSGRLGDKETQQRSGDLQQSLRLAEWPWRGAAWLEKHFGFPRAAFNRWHGRMGGVPEVAAPERAGQVVLQRDAVVGHA